MRLYQQILCASLLGISLTGIALGATTAAQTTTTAAPTVTAAPTPAPVPDEKTFMQNLAASGLTYELKGQSLAVSIDMVKALNTIPKLQEMGYINKNVTQADVIHSPVILSFMIGMLFTAVIVHHEYMINKGLDQVNVKSYLLVPDKKGKLNKEMCFSFGFNRKIFKKVDWDKITEGGFAKASQNFLISDWCYQQLAKEKKAKK